MTDITERLRALVALDLPDRGGPYGGIAARECMDAMREAAAEIERLRACLEAVANNTGCVEACPCWAKLRRKAELALLGCKP